MDKFDSFISVYGGPSALGRALGVPPQVVCNWRVRGVPIDHAAKVEKLSAGAVMRWDLRPNDWKDIWPELTERKDAPPIPEQAHD